MRRHARAILGRIPQAEAAIIPGASHASIIERPEAFNLALDAFLESLPSRV